MSEEIIAIEICRYMGGWDWETYLSQPTWFVQLIRDKMNAEARVDNAQRKMQEIAAKKH